MCGKQSSTRLWHGGRSSLLGCVMALLVLFSGSVWAQESTPSQLVEGYLLSPSDRQTLIGIFQTLAQKLRATEQNLSELQTSSEQLKTTYGELSLQYQDSQKQIKNMQQQYNDLETMYQQLKIQYATLEAQSQQLTSSNTILQTASEDLSKQIQDLVSKLTTLERESTIWEEKYKQQVADYQALQATYNKALASSKAYEQSVQALNSKSIILEIILGLVALGWGLDAIGVF